MSNIVVTFEADESQRNMFRKTFPSHELAFLTDYGGAQEKESVLKTANIMISWNPTNELRGMDPRSLRNIRFIQLISAGYDHLNFEMFPETCAIAANQGAYALPMAEHVLAMILSRAKKLRKYHNLLTEGRFEQRNGTTKRVTGSTLGIIGFGSIGKETVRLMRPFNVKVLALNTTGRTDEHVDFCGTLKDLGRVLTDSEFIVVSIPLTKETEGLIGNKELAKMKSDAVLVNVARGAIVREKDLYEHLKTHPDFSACIDAWWVEPFRHGKFSVNYPFFELPNLLGSPHNSAIVDGIMLEGATRAAENASRFLNRERVAGVISRPQTISV